MFTSLRRRDQSWFLSGMVAVLSVAACTGEAERARSVESTVAAAPGSDADSAMTTSEQGATPAESTPAVAPQAAQTALPKPSIDPGRKPAEPAKRSPAARPKDRSDTAAAGSSAPAASTSTNPEPAAGQSKWLKYDAATNTVTFELIGGPFTWNGFSSGGGTLLVPPKANIVMNFVNKDGTPHSAEIISGEGPLPNAAVDPAIPRAYTNKVLEGLAQEGSDVMKFAVPESGTYRIFCGVPGHGLSGMWIWMKVDPAAKAPSFGPTKS